ncbi:hypothetical protein E3P99_00073 [Wallemia hederae]|uniref:Queuosine 5'-phosphate N-glycosylase/hydrolase n=1 Tax=Wallemia hederae TaxID=1540922 RepID=A0A4T0FYP8_9BASI|nr:hypothetical protein E3P99_00073 [Wallemia hederae]
MVLSLLVLLSLFSLSHSFSFNVTQVKECDTFEIQWSGANPPANFVAIPNGNPPDESNPDRVLVAQDVGNDADGSFRYTTWPMAEGVNFTVTMGDADGFGTGGTSDILFTGEGAGGHCFQSGYIAFSFYAQPETGWDSCQSISLHTINKTGDTPFDYYAISPNSKPVLIDRLTDNNAVANYEFTQPVGTQVVIFAASEGNSLQYSSGGSSQIQTLGEGSDTSCVKQLEASPTDRSAPSSTGGSGGSGSDNDSDDLSAGAKAGAAVGSIIGAAALIAAIVAFVLLKKKKNEDRHEHAQKVKHGGGYGGDVDEGLDGSYTPYIMTGAQNHRHSDSRYSSVPTDANQLTASDDNHHTYGGIPPSPSSGGLLLGAGATNASHSQSHHSNTADSKSRHAYHVSNSTNTKEQPTYHVDAGPYVANNGHNDDEEALQDVPPAYNFGQHGNAREGGVSMTLKIDGVRESAQAVVRSGVVNISDEVISTLLANINPSTFTKLSTEHGYKLPLKFESVEEELTIIGLLTVLNFGSGYRSMLHQHTGLGAFDNVKRFVLALFLSKDSGHLSADGLAGFTLENTIDMVNLNPFHEHPHPTLPGVVVGERDQHAFEYLNLITTTLNDVGRTLQALRKQSFGAYLLDVFGVASGDTSTSTEADSVVTELVNRFECFRDEYVVKLDTEAITVRLYKKALLLVEVVNSALKKHSLAPVKTPPLPIFSDNVIPSMLLHWGVLEIPDDSEVFGKEVRDAFTHTASEHEAMVDLLREEQKKDLLAEVVAGPTLSPLQACLLRSSAIEAIRRMSVRSTASEVEYDAFVWSISKQQHYRSLVRFSEVETLYY